jgi:RNA polymerase sigma-70 factor (ECF subfamily)
VVFDVEGATMDDVSFSELVVRARTGEAEAVEQLLRSFEDEVRVMVRVRLPRALRSQFDSMDFVQAVWQSVLADPDPEAPSFDNPRHFRGYLAGVAQNKVWEAYRRRTSKKYDLGREESLYVRRAGREQARDVAAPDPTPSQEVQANDRLEQLLAGRPPVEAEVVRLRLEGRTFNEIAATTGLHERTVRKIIDTLRERMEARQWR